MLDRAEAEVVAIPPGGVVLGAARVLAIAHARLGSFDRAVQRLAVWPDNAPARRTVLEEMRSAGASAAAHALEAELDALIAAASDHHPLLVAAEMARAAGDRARMRGFLDRARAAATSAELSAGFRNACEVVKAMAESGEIDAARDLLATLEHSAEWGLLTTATDSAEAADDEDGADDADDADNTEVADNAEDAEDAEEVTVDAGDAAGLADALLALGDVDRSRAMFERALALAGTDDDVWVNPDLIEALVRLSAGTGRLADRVEDIVAVTMRQSHDWIRAQHLAAGAGAAVACGDSASAQIFVHRALGCAASGGRTAFFEILERFARGLSLLGVPGFEWQLFEMCEDVDGWWLADDGGAAVARAGER
jgi:tetratricopeptide (TPR) repeat protein